MYAFLKTDDMNMSAPDRRITFAFRLSSTVNRADRSHDPLSSLFISAGVLVIDDDADCTVSIQQCLMSGLGVGGGGRQMKTGDEPNIQEAL